MAEPTMTPSEKADICLACSGVEIPNPTAHGIFVFFALLSEWGLSLF